MTTQEDTTRDALLVLEDGVTFRGTGFGAAGESFGEMVFNTGMTGYQETLTDPSYCGQIVAMTAPHIGNTGINDEDGESRRMWVRGYVVREPARLTSSWRAARSLDDELRAQNVTAVAIGGTRALTRHLRDRGAMRAGISTTERDPAALLERVRRSPQMAGADLAREVSTEQAYTVAPPPGTPVRYRVAAVDLGIKASTPRYLAGLGCEVRVLPAGSTAAQIKAENPDGVFFANGPGDPAALDYAVDAMRGVLGAGLPTFGICLGSQVMGRALGLKTYKLRFGHRGVNQPVQDLRTGRVEITSHNHGFAVALPPGAAPGTRPRAIQFDTPFGHAEITHVNLNDGVVEGLRLLDAPAFTVQYHPEAAPGPHDATGLFAQFCALMETARGGAMPKREDLKSVLVIGSGPIIIGQACEFDYSGTQACRVLREEGIRVSLVNSNPATIMTDPEFADATYVEPITQDVLEKVIARERPDAILPTLGGQTALNAAVMLHEAGTLARYDVELIGASIDAIQSGEDRSKFKQIVADIGAETPESRICHTLAQCEAAAAELGFPVVIRPSFTLGGTGSGIARDAGQLRRIAGAGLDASPVTEVLLEESVLGWKEFELELMRDRRDNVVIVCSIENIDPMGVHTGDSVTVAPAMTLTDREYQHMRDVAIATARAVGVDTGGCNIQFAVHPGTGRMVVIEMNPRVSRSSALASKATGFPIAKIAARLAIGYTLDEIRNDITGETPASFEPALDYVVVKVPRFAFEKFPGADPTLTTHMKSVGEAMAIGRSFPEALQKALRSLESPSAPLRWDAPPGDAADLTARCAVPHDGRLATVHQALRAGATVGDLAAASGIDPWFLDQIEGIEDLAKRIAAAPSLPRELVFAAKAAGFSDAQLGQLTGRTEAAVRDLRYGLGVRPVYLTVDTCAAEFAARTPYLYSAYDEQTEVPPGDRPKVIILGSGPNRIGQGIEFDYACVHASFALAAAGYETVMVNCNPETVSTDYDTSGRLYFEPLTLEDVLEVVAAEQAAGPVAGVIVQLGGQTPLGLARDLAAAGVPIVGTSPEAIHLAEDRGEFGAVLEAAGLPAPRSGTATTVAEATAVAAEIGYPVLVRPSYVLGGRGMEIVYDDATLAAYVSRATQASPDHPVLIDRFLDDAIEIDVDALYDGQELYLGGVMEHIEEAGIHSGDSACALPPITLGSEYITLIRDSTRAIARGVGVRGLLNVQYALAAGVLYVLEANPRASRTVPFVSKATAVPLAKAAARIMLGATVPGLRAEGLLPPSGDGGTLPLDAPIAVKEAVLPFSRFADARGQGVDTVLGPEMRSTGEVMGIDEVFGTAYAKSQAAAYASLPVKGRAFVSIAGKDKRSMIFPVKRLADLGFEILATRGTGEVLRRNGVRATIVRKHSDGPGPDGEPTIVDRILDGQVDLIVNTPFGSPGQAGPRLDGYEIRTAAVRRGIPCVTTVQGLAAAVQGIEAITRDEVGVRSLQEHAARLRESGFGARAGEEQVSS